MLLAALFLRESINRKKTLGVVLGISGVWVLISQMDISSPGTHNLLGISFAVINTVMLGLYLIIIRKVAAKYSPVTLQKWMLLFATCSLLPFGLEELPLQRIYSSDIHFVALLQLGFVLLFATVLKSLLLPFALKRIKPTVASVYINLQPIIASVVAIMIGQDIFSWDQPVSALLVIAGVLLVSLNR